MADFLVRRLGRGLLGADVEVVFVGDAIDVEVYVEADVMVPDAELKAAVEEASAYGIGVADALVELIKAGKSIGNVEEAKRLVASLQGGQRGDPPKR